VPVRKRRYAASTRVVNRGCSAFLRLFLIGAAPVMLCPSVSGWALARQFMTKDRGRVTHTGALMLLDWGGIPNWYEHSAATCPTSPVARFSGGGSRHEYPLHG
jgi:hypothetical protein